MASASYATCFPGIGRLKSIAFARKDISRAAHCFSIGSPSSLPLLPNFIGTGCTRMPPLEPCHHHQMHPTGHHRGTTLMVMSPQKSNVTPPGASEACMAPELTFHGTEEGHKHQDHYHPSQSPYHDVIEEEPVLSSEPFSGKSCLSRGSHAIKQMMTMGWMVACATAVTVGVQFGSSVTKVLEMVPPLAHLEAVLGLVVTLNLVINVVNKMKETMNLEEDGRTVAVNGSLAAGLSAAAQAAEVSAAAEEEGKGRSSRTCGEQKLEPPADFLMIEEDERDVDRKRVRGFLEDESTALNAKRQQLEKSLNLSAVMVAPPPLLGVKLEEVRETAKLLERELDASWGLTHEVEHLEGQIVIAEAECAQAKDQKKMLTRSLELEARVRRILLQRLMEGRGSTLTADKTQSAQSFSSEPFISVTRRHTMSNELRRMLEDCAEAREKITILRTEMDTITSRLHNSRDRQHSVFASHPELRDLFEQELKKRKEICKLVVSSPPSPSAAATSALSSSSSKRRKMTDSNGTAIVGKWTHQTILSIPLQSNDGNLEEETMAVH